MKADNFSDRVMNYISVGTGWLDQQDFETRAHCCSESGGGCVWWTGTSSPAVWDNEYLIFHLSYLHLFDSDLTERMKNRYSVKKLEVVVSQTL